MPDPGPGTGAGPASTWRIEHLAQVGSTNDEARARARDGDPGQLLIVAAEQLSGRGRRGRQWYSPPGNLYCSALLRPDMAPAQGGLYSFVAAVALADAIAECAPMAAPHLTCKWPNDLRIAGAKVSGILLESGARADGGIDHLIIGTGVNVRFTPPGADERYPATCLADHGQPDLATATAAYLRHLAAWCARFAEQGFAPVRQAWLARAEGLGQEIVVRLGQEELHGRFLAFAADGALCLGLRDGSTRTIVSGEIVQTVPVA